MASTHTSRLSGLILIAFGATILIANIAGVSWGQFWPAFMILGGVWFIALFLRDRKNYGVLMPASIFLTIGCLFLYHSLAGWHDSYMTWPVYIAAPGIGFFAMYYFGKREDGLLVPAFILTGIATLFILLNTDNGQFWPAIIIIVGLALILKRR